MLALVCAALILSALAAGIGPVLILGMTGTRGMGESLAALASDTYLHRVILFTLGQAALSTLLSLLVAVPVARALARRSAFPGRSVLVQTLGIPLLLPALVGVLALVALYGRKGWVSAVVATMGGEIPPLYGLGGILLAHVFFNMPLAVRILLRPLEAIPGESWRLAAQLGFSPRQVFRWIDWPVLRRSLPSVAALIFLLCSGSFTIVLALGGGPRATTLEVALYEALRLDFDPGRAAGLALLQTLLCLIVGGILLRLTPPAVPLSLGPGRPVGRPDGGYRRTHLLDGFWLGLAGLFTGGPLLGLALTGLSGPLTGVLTDPDLWAALLNSLRLTVLAAPLAVLIGLGLLLGARGFSLRAQRIVTGLGTLPLALPPIVVGTGWFILFRPLVLAPWVAIGLTVALAALMALPYTIRVLAPAVADAAARHDRLCAALGLSGWQRFRLVDFPALRRALVTALALAAALALGDFGAVALFGAADTAALPLLLFSRMGSYRFDEAAVIALFLLMTGLAVFWGIEKGLGRDHRA